MLMVNKNYGALLVYEKLVRGMNNVWSVYFDCGIVITMYLLGFSVLLVIFGVIGLAQEAKP